MDTPTVTDFWKEWSLTGADGKGVSGRLSKKMGGARVVGITPGKLQPAKDRLKALNKKARSKKGLTEGEETRRGVLKEKIRVSGKGARTGIKKRKKSRRKAVVKMRKKVAATAAAKKKTSGSKPKAKKPKAKKPKAGRGGARTRRTRKPK